MLPVPFSFAGRISRWSFFKACVLLAVSCIVPAVLAMGFAEPLQAGKRSAFFGLIAFFGLCAIVVFWISLTFQTRRCRDMGWNPLAAMLAWGAVQVLDPILAYLAPSISTGGGTAIGGAFNLAWILALTFWPSAEGSGSVSGTRSPTVPPGQPRSRLEALQLSSSPTGPAASPSVAALPRRMSFGQR